MSRVPGCGRCLELLTPAAWLPSASQSSNKRGRRRGEEEEPGASAAPFTQQPKPGQAARAAPWGRPRSGGGGGSEGASLSETPSSSTQHALSAGRCGTTLPPPPLLGLRQCGSLVSLESPFRQGEEPGARSGACFRGAYKIPGAPGGIMTAQRGTARRDGREATGCSPASCTWLARSGAPSFPAKLM
ncbi:uncharacterized protein LOC105738931 [Nomascus leucogenys]|uniref:uncharacterized protein LOC105738931 n=1 Tax=Nomascus leucogenys TaxID=61853 RepID=UPI00122D5307|nr:uncharacterized protein LOC105738931 [Nomascus leucogenys]